MDYYCEVCGKLIFIVFMLQKWILRTITYFNGRRSTENFMLSVNYFIEILFLSDFRTNDDGNKRTIGMAFQTT